MVFKKKSRGDLKTRFKRGRVDPMKGKTFKICWEAESQPFKRLFKEETEILQQEDDLKIRLLRPKANKITEVEKCDSKSVGLFEAEPDMRSLFPKVFQINSDNQLEIDIDRDLLKKHAAIVMEGLGAVVEIMDDSDFLNNVLISIGQTHYHRHVRPSMLKRLWPALHASLQNALQEIYTKEVSDAWKKVFDYVCIYMKFGIEHPEIYIDADDSLVITHLS